MNELNIWIIGVSCLLLGFFLGALITQIALYLGLTKL